MELMRKKFSTLCCALFLHLVTPLFCQAIDIRTIALRDQPAPGTSKSFAYFGLGYNTFPSINNLGQVAFVGSLDDGIPGIANVTGVWSEATGALELVALRGDPDPGNPRGVFENFGYVGISDSGRVNFANVDNFFGIWSVWSKFDTDSVVAVAGRGQVAPGSGGSTFSSLVLAPRYHSSGDVVVWGHLSGEDATQGGLWTDRSGALELAVSSGNIAPDTNGAIFGGEFFPFSITDDGTIAFFTSLTGTGVDSSNDLGLWRESAGGFELLARLGDPAPGTESAYKRFKEPAVISYPASSHAFRAVLNSGAHGIWAVRNGEVERVIQSGNIAPGTSIPAKYFSEPNVNKIGDVVFTSSGLGASVLGIWSTLNHELRLVAADGGTVPMMADLKFDLYPSTPEINNRGQVAFSAGLIGSDGNILNSLWIHDQHGALHLVAKEGDLLEISPGDLREITQLEFQSRTFGGRNTEIPRFNDRGQVVFFAAFNNGSSGLFVSSPLVVPEPGSGCLLLAVSITLLLSRLSSAARTA
jgi:hypothetical protein